MSDQRTKTQLKKIVVTGSSGLLGTHLRIALNSCNAARRYLEQPELYQIECLAREDFNSTDVLENALRGCAAVIHLAGVNRAATDAEVQLGNQNIAQALVKALEAVGGCPLLIYTNSTHAEHDSPYGLGKRTAAAIFHGWAEAQGAVFLDLVLPHVFGEGGKPFYNTVTATLCHQVFHGEQPTIHDGAAVELVHAGDVADHIIESLSIAKTTHTRMHGTKIDVRDLYDRLVDFRDRYKANMFPDLSDVFNVRLFNTYRSVVYANETSSELATNVDDRGVLFEAVKGGGGGQTFLSWTKPGIERGNHYHIHKVERFLVLSGNAQIRIRQLYSEQITRIDVSGDSPTVIDIPTLHAHSIVNTGESPLLTLFWAHEIFDKQHPDTYPEMVETTN